MKNIILELSWREMVFWEIFTHHDDREYQDKKGFVTIFMRARKEV